MKTKQLFQFSVALFLVLAVVQNSAAEQPLKLITPPGVVIHYKQRELDAPPAIKSKLESLRKMIKEENWTFEVGYTTAMDYPIEQITGLKVPRGFLALAMKQNIAVESLLNKKLISTSLGQWFQHRLALRLACPQWLHWYQRPKWLR